MKYLFLILFLCVACSTTPNNVNVEVPNPFESEYEMNAVKSDLSGTSTYRSLNNDIYIISIETDCDDPKICPTVDIFVSNDFNENIVYTKDFDVIPGDFSDVLLFPNGKCAVPFSVDSGTLEITKSEDGSFSGDFNVESREIDGYQPDSRIGCSESNYSSEGLRTLSFEGTFTSFIKEEAQASN